MEKITCDVIGDLLPLYVDQACSDDSRSLVDEHLVECEGCRSMLNAMRAENPVGPATDCPAEKKILHSVRNHLLAIGLALIMIVGCFIGNWRGAWDGGPASLDALLLSIGYVLFWIWFCLNTYRYRSLVQFSLVMSILTFLSAALGFVLRITESGGFLSVVPALLTSVPFYGFRYFMDWTGIYAAVSVLSLIWMLLLARNRRWLKDNFPDNRAA